MHKIKKNKDKPEHQFDKEQQKLIAELVQQFKDDQLKFVFRRCLHHIQKYGLPAFSKAIELQLKEDPSEDPSIYSGLETEASIIHNGVSHSHEEFSKRNASFLIESSEKVPNYDQKVLREMKIAFEKGNYDDVADLAYLHDRNKRTVIRRETDIPVYKPESPWERFSDLLDEVVAEKDETPLQFCVEALRHLSSDLTYDSRNAAKEAIRKAIRLME